MNTATLTIGRAEVLVDYDANNISDPYIELTVFEGNRIKVKRKRINLNYRYQDKLDDAISNNEQARGWAEDL